MIKNTLLNFTMLVQQLWRYVPPAAAFRMPSAVSNQFVASRARGNISLQMGQFITRKQLEHRRTALLQQWV